MLSLCFQKIRAEAARVGTSTLQDPETRSMTGRAVAMAKEARDT
jgi:hypothetical protein